MNTVFVWIDIFTGAELHPTDPRTNLTRSSICIHNSFNPSPHRVSKEGRENIRHFGIRRITESRIDSKDDVTESGKNYEDEDIQLSNAKIVFICVLMIELC